MKEKISKLKISSRRVVVTSFLVDISDIIINTFVTVLTGSVVVLSQALKGMADLLATGFLLIGILKAQKPDDRKHPYGHGRELYFWAFLSALATFIITAGFSFYFGLKRFLAPMELDNLIYTYLALAVAAIANGYSFYLSLRRLLGKKPFIEVLHTFKFSALIETKTTLVLDLMGTIASFFGLIAIALYQLTGNLRFDGIGAMIIAVILAFLAFFVIRSAKDLLVGQSAPPEVEDEIIRVTKADPNVQDVLDLRTLHIGPERILVNMEIHLADELTTDEIEVLIDKIEKEIKEEIPVATNIQIELETPDVDK